MKNLVATITIFLLFFNSISYSNNYKGHWKGYFMLQGSSWPMQLHVEQSKSDLKVLLDIPNLVYAREPMEASIDNGIIEITFPFGIGKRRLKKEGDKLVSIDKQQSLHFLKTNAPPYDIKPISWRSGKEILKGSIYIPKKKKNPPLLIRLHGANKGTRKDWEYRSWADYFARKGIATIIFDRRGEGASTGNSNDYGLEKLSYDVITLLEKVKERKDIDMERVILSGASQAGYISFMVNEKSDDIDYMLLSAASSLSLIEQERQRLLFRMQKNKELPESINSALAYQQLYFYYIITGQNWSVLQKAAIEAQKAEWGKYIDQPQKETDLKWWRNSFDDFQPEKLIPKIKIPTLILFGENDVSTPPSVMIPRFKYLLKDSRNNILQTVVCPNVGHSMEVQFSKDRWGKIVFPQRSPKMFEAIEKWLYKFVLE